MYVQCRYGDGASSGELYGDGDDRDGFGCLLSPRGAAVGLPGCNRCIELPREGWEGARADVNRVGRAHSPLTPSRALQEGGDTSEHNKNHPLTRVTTACCLCTVSSAEQRERPPSAFCYSEIDHGTAATAAGCAIVRRSDE
jgi:hypothetical protein